MGVNLSTGKIVALGETPLLTHRGITTHRQVSPLTAVLGAVFVLLLVGCLVFAGYATCRAHREDAEAGLAAASRWKETGTLLTVQHIPTPIGRAKGSSPSRVVLLSSGEGFARGQETWEKSGPKQPERVYQPYKYPLPSKLDLESGGRGGYGFSADREMQADGRAGLGPVTAGSDGGRTGHGSTVRRDETQQGRGPRGPPVPPEAEKVRAVARAQASRAGASKARARSKERPREYFEDREKMRTESRARGHGRGRDRDTDGQLENYKVPGTEHGARQADRGRTRGRERDPRKRRR